MSPAERVVAKHSLVTWRWPHGGTTGPSLLTCAKAINGDDVAAEDILARVHALRHLLQQVGHDV